MTRKSASVPSLTYKDIKLRIFVDTNVIIDYIQGLDERKSKSFIDLFNKRNFDNIELVTSDYVLWEFYGHFKDELYVKKLVDNHHYGYVSANKECFRRGFRKADSEDIERFGTTIKDYVDQFERKPITIERLVGRELDGFSNSVDKILQCSKFSYKDAIVFVSAVFTGSQIIVTLDETFSSENHIEELSKELVNLKTAIGDDIDTEFRKPGDFCTENNAKLTYKEWFLKRNGKKQIGEVIQVWTKKNVIGVSCATGRIIKEGDYLCLVRFKKRADFAVTVFEVEKGNLWDFRTNRSVSKGNKVTIKLPPKKGVKNEMLGGMIFLYAD